MGARHSEIKGGGVKPKQLRAPLKMRFLCGSIVGDVLASSCMAYTLRCCVRRRLTTTEKSLFLEAPLSLLLFMREGASLFISTVSIVSV